MERFPAHVVCKWIGNSQPVAAKHYLQVTEGHYAKAVQNAVHDPVQNATELPGKEPQAPAPEDAEACVCGALQNNAAPCDGRELRSIPPRGVEPLSPG